MDELEPALAAMRNRWAIGGSARGVAPKAWQDLTQDDAEPDLILATLAGQSLDYLFAPQPSGPLTLRPLLPALSLPSMSATQRALFRRALERCKQTAVKPEQLVWLAATRGVTAHPADWMPSSANANLPTVYAPWLAWLGGQSGPAAGETIKPETWSDWSWPDRRRAAEELRLRDPAAGRELIAAVAAKEPAEKRLELVHILRHGLSDADSEYLSSFDSDRSEKVRSLVRGLRARLGQLSTPGAVEAELAGFFKLVEKGLLRKTRHIVPEKMKTPAQSNRRAELFQLASFGALAAHFGMNETVFLEAFGRSTDVSADVLITDLAVRTGSSTVRQALLASQASAFDLPLETFKLLLDDLPEIERTKWIRRHAIENANGFYETLMLSDHTFGFLDEVAVQASSSWRNLQKQIAQSRTDGSDMEYHLFATAAPLGLLATASAARWTIRSLSSDQLSSAHPAFDILQFNAGLEGP